jgi:Iron-containing redox enzyme
VSTIANGHAAETLAEIRAMANAQFESPEFRQLLSLRMTMERARFFTIEMARYVQNRRDCWAYAQGSVPLDVKRLIWAHEQEELMEDPVVGMDHFTLATREAAVLGLTGDDIASAPLSPGSVTAFYAWIQLAKDRPWLESVASCSIMEVRNSPAIIEGGSLSARIRKKFVEDLGLPEEQLINTGRHSVADEVHAGLMQEVIEAHVRTPADQAAIIRGARDSLIIDRAFRGALAITMATM